MSKLTVLKIDNVVFKNILVGLVAYERLYAVPVNAGIHESAIEIVWQEYGM